MMIAPPPALNSFENMLREVGLKGLSTFTWTCSGFKDNVLLILPQAFIFILVKPLKTAAIPGKNVESSLQILIAPVDKSL